MITPPSTQLLKFPYRGIESFRYIDEVIFFAREEEKQRLLRYITIYRGVLFYGDSGSGKSSLINAGLLPAIIKEGFIPDRLRVQPRRNEEIIVERISTSAEGKAPFLPSNFADDKDISTRVVLSIDTFKKKLQELPENQRPVLIFDQFEEFITLFEEAQHGEALKEALLIQKAILNALVELLRDHSLPVKLLFVFREDYLAKLTKLFALYPGLPDQYLRLVPPRTESLYEIIRGPFEKFPKDFGKELSPELARNLATAIEERSGSGMLNLSEVQIACVRLYQSNDPEALFKEKGVQGLLEDYLSDALNQLDNYLRDPAVALLSRMITTFGTRNIISADDLINRTRDEENIAQDRLEKALDALEKDTKLVRRERRHDTYFYDIASEFLVPWIGRQKADRLAVIERRKLEEAERLKRRKAYKWASALASIALVIAVGIGLFAWREIQMRTYVVLQDQELKKALAHKAQAEKDRDEFKAKAAALSEQNIALERQIERLQSDFRDLRNQYEVLLYKRRTLGK